MEELQYIQFCPMASILFIVTIGASLVAFQNRALLDKWMLSPYEFIHYKKYYLIFTSGFIHGDLMHLMFNMLSFYFFAFPLELLMVAWAGPVGHLFFALIYMLSIMLSDISTIRKYKDDPGYRSLGASGAITAIIFSFILFAPATKISLMFIPIGVPAPIFAILYIGYSIYANRSMRGNINHEAHISGAFIGMILTILFFHGILPQFIKQVFG